MCMVDYRKAALLLVLLLATQAYSQTWNWAAQIATFSTGGFGTNKVLGVTVDANENIFIVGDYGDSAMIGATKVKGFGVGAEMYVARLNSSGTVAWAKSFGSSGFLDQSIDITNDPLGNVYVCGSFFGNWDFGTVQYPIGAATVGLAKYNSNGDVQWAKQVPGLTAGPGGATYGYDHVYVAAGRALAKFTLDGDTAWTRTIPTSASYFVQYRDVTVDVWGCIYVVGEFKGTITYGTTTLSSASANDPDILIVKYEPDGSVMWARQAGAVSSSGQEDVAEAVTTSAHGEVYVVGQYRGKAGFDTDSISTGNALKGMFVVKYDSEGALQWVRGSNSSTGSTATANGVKVLSNDDVLVAASFSIAVTVADTTVNIAGGADVLMIRFSPEGARRWAKRSDTFATNAGSLCLATNLSGTAAYIGGQFNSALTLGPTSMTIAAGVTDGWLGKMAIPTATAVREIAESPLPESYSLSQNYPNPFNPTTTIEFKVASASRVSVGIFNVLGQRVRTLIDEDLAAGAYATDWDGNDDSGRKLASGVYLYRLQAGEFSETRKMTLLK